MGIPELPDEDPPPEIADALMDWMLSLPSFEEEEEDEDEKD